MQVHARHRKCQEAEPGHRELKQVIIDFKKKREEEMASDSTKRTDETHELTVAALRAADALCTAVISGKPGQQKLALEYARAIDSAKRAGLDLTKND